jgi:uncharacterized membrane protein YhaH (DUF805 family)
MGYYSQSWSKYADFDGRARRSEYWIFSIINLIIYGIILAIESSFNVLIDDFLFGPFSILFGLVILIPSWAVLVRRLHDIGRSGFWVFISIIPILGPIILLIFSLMDSESRTNEYGVNPKKKEIQGSSGTQGSSSGQSTNKLAQTKDSPEISPSIQSEERLTPLDFDTKISRLEKLGKLYEQGVLTKDEFLEEKNKILHKKELEKLITDKSIDNKSFKDTQFLEHLKEEINMAKSLSFGRFHQPLVDLLKSKVIDTASSEIIAGHYNDEFGQDLIEEIKNCSSNLSDIEDYLESFIAIKFVEAKWPHRLIKSGR